MKTYSLTEGEVPHAGTSIAQNRESGNRRSLAEGTADPTSRAAGHARSIETSHQATGRTPQHVSSLWREAASRAAARGGRADMLPCRPGGFINREGRAAHVGGIGWRLGV